MAKILLDTNICIYIINNKPEYIKDKFMKYEMGDIAISSISVAELFFGVEKSKFKENNIKALNAFVSNLEIIDFGFKEAMSYAKLRANLEKRKSLIGAMDMLISAVGLANDLTIITNNIKEFQRVENLKFENWV